MSHPLLGWKASLAAVLHSKWPFTLPTGVRTQTIHQWPRSRVQPVGSPLSLECTVRGASNPYLYWYRQAGGGALQLLFYSVGAGQVDSEAPQHLEASRPQDGTFVLNSTKLLLSDSGFYLCAWSPTLSWVGPTSVQKPRPLLSPHSGTGWRGLAPGFLTISQCESNQMKPGSPKELS